ncbi:MAG: hypothetical protein AMXMBFR57_00620 [Acidimicrobiia bacterium]|jgi:predicted permease
MILKRPGTSALAIIALALGIGLTTTMFSIVQGAILRGLPFEDSHLVQMLTTATPTNPVGSRSVAVHDFEDWRAATSFERIEGYTQTSFTLTGGGGFPERMRGVRVTPGLFTALRAAPVLGRDFTAADAEAGAPKVIILGHTAWQTRFSSNPDAIGQVVYVDGEPTTVIGVMPPRFAFPQSQNAWMPLHYTLPAKRRTGAFLTVVGRLKSDVSPSEARTEMRAISERLASAYPENKDVRAGIAPFVEQAIGPDVVSTLLTMLGAVFGVMLIACVNVTNLQLARAAERTRDTAIRTALGAGRWRIVRQTLTEGLLLSAVGASLGLALAWVGADLFNRAIVDTDPPFWIDVRLDPVVLAFVTVITVSAALVSSLVPGWRLARTGVSGVMKDEGRGTTSLRMGRFTRGLVMVEVAVSSILLVVSALMIRSIILNSRLDVPFATEDVLVTSIQLDNRTYPAVPEVRRGLQQVELELSRLSGIRTFALATGAPRSGGGALVAVDGESYAATEDYPRSGSIIASPAYFDVLRVPPVEGRAFTAQDAEGSLPVAIVDESFARQYLSGSAVGRRIRFGSETDKGVSFENAPWLTVVGVVPQVVEEQYDSRQTAQVFRPIAQVPVRSLTIFAASAGATPTALANPIRTALAGIGDGIPMSSALTLAESIWREGWPARVFGGLFTAFGFAALVLASAGLYGVMAFSVRQRTGEIGVRMAMGADRRTVLRMILWQGMWRVVLAVVIGLVPGWRLAILMSELLRGVSPLDPTAYIGTAVTLLLSAFVACLVPALRAASVDPMVALRTD